MKKCNTQIMKELKKLEENRTSWLSFEKNNCTVTYCANEEPIIPDYSYDEVSKQIEWFDTEIRRLKGLLAYSNVTTIVEGFDMTINDALIYLAQLKAKQTRLDSLNAKNKLSRSTVGYGDAIQYTKILYDQEPIAKELAEVTETIMLLQMAIDRTNLTNMIEC